MPLLSLDAREQLGQNVGLDFQRGAFGLGKLGEDETCAMESFRQKAEAVPVKPEDFDAGRALAEKDKQRSTLRLLAHEIASDCCQRIKTLSHVLARGAQQNADAGGKH